MQILSCRVGLWKAYASVEKIAHDKLMAVVQVSDRDDAQNVSSRHTVVFEHEEGGDALAETQAMMHKLLGRRYGA